MKIEPFVTEENRLKHGITLEDSELATQDARHATGRRAWLKEWLVIGGVD